MEEKNQEVKREKSYSKLRQMNSDSDISVKISQSKSKEKITESKITTTIPSKKVNSRIFDGQYQKTSESSNKHHTQSGLYSQIHLPYERIKKAKRSKKRTVNKHSNSNDLRDELTKMYIDQQNDVPKQAICKSKFKASNHIRSGSIKTHTKRSYVRGGEHATIQQSLDNPIKLHKIDGASLQNETEGEIEVTDQIP